MAKELSIPFSKRTSRKINPREQQQVKKRKILPRPLSKKRPIQKNNNKEKADTINSKDTNLTKPSNLVDSSVGSSKSIRPLKSEGKTKCKKRKPDPKTTTITEEERKRFKTHDDVSCIVCNITFVDNDELLQHLRENRFFCRTCISEFDNHSNLANHFTQHKGLKCISCSEIFFCRKDLVGHFKSNPSCANHDSKIQCKFCDKLCYGEQSLKLHVIKLHSVGEGKAECVVCKKKYFSETTLYDHLRVNHVAFEYISCNVCNKLLDGPGKLKKHMKNTHLRNTENSKSSCNICGKVLIDELRLRQHLKVHDQTETLCQHCGKTIKGGNYGMTFHLYKEHPKKPFKCQDCPEQFDKLSKLRSHEAKVHKKNWNKTIDEPQCCEICGKKYKNSSTLRAHYVTHSDLRKFRCDICGATFKQKAALQTHSRIHTGFLPYFCEKCGESFRWKQVRDKHMNKCKGSQDKSASEDSNN